MTKAPKIEARARRWLLRFIWVLAGVTVAGVIGGMALFSRISGLSGWRFHAGDMQGQVPVYTQTQIDRFITSVLIVVQNDALGSEHVRGDMVFIVSFNALEQRLTVVSLLSEMLLEADGPGQASLGVIYAQGGPGLLANTLNENLELDLQSYVCTDTHSLAQLIDLLGGIQTELTAEEARYIDDALGQGDPLKAGPIRLNGIQSMVHALNGVSGDAAFGRAQRQLALVDSAVENLRLTATKDKMIPVLATAFNNFYTNLDMPALRNIGYEILRAEDMEYAELILPFPGSWRYVSVDGERCVRADVTRNAELLREKLYHAE